MGTLKNVCHSESERNQLIKSLIIAQCITPVYGCNGWDITTVEGLGNKEEGYSVIQNRLVNFHGTQVS